MRSEADGTAPADGAGGLPPRFRHDLLNALNAVVGFAGLLVEDLPEGQPKEFARRVLEAGLEAQRLAERLPATAPRGVRVLLVGPAAEAHAAALETLGLVPTPAGTVAEATDALAEAPGAWDVVVAERHSDALGAACGTSGPVLLALLAGEPVHGLAARILATRH